MFELSIIIPTRDRADAIMRALMGIERTTHSTYEVIVVDAASTDATGEVLMLASSFLAQRLRVVRESASVGFGAACNKGIAVARGRNLCVLHDDVQPLEGALDAAIGQLDRAEDDALILALPWDHAPIHEIAEERTIASESFATTHVHGTLVAEFPLARRQTFESLPFDSQLRTSAAAMEFSLRAWTRGHAIASAAATPLRSHVGPQWQELTEQAEREAVIARTSLPKAKTRFDPRSPCTIVRSDVRRVA